MDFKNFNINLIPAINEGYTEHFSKNPNIVGASEIPMGMRKIIISKREGLDLDFKMKLLGGKISHYILQKDEVIENITKEINKALGYTEIEVNGKRFIELENGNYMEFTWEKEILNLIEILPGKYLRMHPDINTSLYTIEIKTTTWPKKMWKDIAAYQIQQLNTYMTFKHNKIGFLLRMDQNFFKSDSKRFSYLWNTFFFNYPFNYSQELWEFTLNRLKIYFNYLDYEANLYNIPCPEFLFECKDKCRDYCPNRIEEVKMDNNDICHHCGKEIRMRTKGLLRNDKIYHYTDGNKNRFEECIKAVKESYLEVKNEEL